MKEEINFESLQIKVPELVKNYPIELKREIFNYLSEMDEHNKKAYEIAIDHLGSSFNIYRSNGFKEWKQKNN
jgi:hypothetical protein